MELRFRNAYPPEPKGDLMWQLRGFPRHQEGDETVVELPDSTLTHTTKGNESYYEFPNGNCIMVSQGNLFLAQPHSVSKR